MDTPCPARSGKLTPAEKLAEVGRAEGEIRARVERGEYERRVRVGAKQIEKAVRTVGGLGGDGERCVELLRRALAVLAEDCGGVAA